MMANLTKLTGLEGECVLVRLDQIACAYPSNLYGAGDDSNEFDVETLACTRLSMICGDVLHVIESPEEILALAQAQ